MRVERAFSSAVFFKSYRLCSLYVILHGGGQGDLPPEFGLPLTIGIKRWDSECDIHVKHVHSFLFGGILIFEPSNSIQYIYSHWEKV